MYAAISGLDANQTMLDETANDLANVNTVGYKAVSVTFADSLTQVFRGASGPTADQRRNQPVQIGLGVQVGATINEMSEGSFQSTNNPLDVAIEARASCAWARAPQPRRTHQKACRPSLIHARRRPQHQPVRAADHAGRRIRGRAQRVVTAESETGNTYEPGKEDSYILIPPGSPMSRSGRTARSATPTRTKNRKPICSA